METVSVHERNLGKEKGNSLLMLELKWGLQVLFEVVVLKGHTLSLYKCKECGINKVPRRYRRKNWWSNLSQLAYDSNLWGCLEVCMDLLLSYIFLSLEYRWCIDVASLLLVERDVRVGRSRGYSVFTKIRSITGSIFKKCNKAWRYTFVRAYICITSALSC